MRARGEDAREPKGRRKAQRPSRISRRSNGARCQPIARACDAKRASVSTSSVNSYTIGATLHAGNGKGSRGQLIKFHEMWGKCGDVRKAYDGRRDAERDADVCERHARYSDGERDRHHGLLRHERDEESTADYARLFIQSGHCSIGLRKRKRIVK